VPGALDGGEVSDRRGLQAPTIGFMAAPPAPKKKGGPAASSSAGGPAGKRQRKAGAFVPIPASSAMSSASMVGGVDAHSTPKKTILRAAIGLSSAATLTGNESAHTILPPGGSPSAEGPLTMRSVYPTLNIDTILSNGEALGRSENGAWGLVFVGQRFHSL
jgi:hypothetical protein